MLLDLLQSRSQQRTIALCQTQDTRTTQPGQPTHQLFQQSRPASGEAGRKANCWLIEGIAMYMESLRRRDNCFVLGGRDDVRVEAARRHLEKNDFYVPFDKLSRMGVRDVQTHPHIAMLYSQIAAMTSFLVHYQNGRYRDALVSCLRAIYDGSQDPDLLARTTGVDYAEMDKQYRAYMASGDKLAERKSEITSPKSQINSNNQ